jgi:pantothenate kinase
MRPELLAPTLDAIEDLVRRNPQRRVVVGITGPPGAGKSTLAEAVVAEATVAAVCVPMDGFHLSNMELQRLGLVDRKGAPETFDAAGFVYLLQRIAAVKPTVDTGNPEFQARQDRDEQRRDEQRRDEQRRDEQRRDEQRRDELHRDEQDEHPTDLHRHLRDDEIVYAPAYSRVLHESIGGTIPVPSTATLIVVEGNYLLLSQRPWSAVRPLLDLSFYVDVPDEIRISGLVRRQQARGLDEQQARDWVERSDEANARLIATTRESADIVITRHG